MKNKIVNWGIIIFGTILIISLSRSIYDLWQKRSILDEARERVRKAEEENANLREKYREVQSPEYIEQTAREKLGLGRDGEVVVVLPRNDKRKNEK